MAPATKLNALARLERTATAWTRERGIEHGEIGLRQDEVRCGAVLVDMGDRTGLRDCDHPVVAQRPGQGDLRWRSADRLCDTRKGWIGDEPALLDRAIGQMAPFSRAR